MKENEVHKIKKNRLGFLKGGSDDELKVVYPPGGHDEPRRDKVFKRIFRKLSLTRLFRG